MMLKRSHLSLRDIQYIQTSGTDLVIIFDSCRQRKVSGTHINQSLKKPHTKKKNFLWVKNNTDTPHKLWLNRKNTQWRNSHRPRYIQLNFLHDPQLGHIWDIQARKTLTVQTWINCAPFPINKFNTHTPVDNHQAEATIRKRCKQFRQPRNYTVRSATINGMYVSSDSAMHTTSEILNNPEAWNTRLSGSYLLFLVLVLSCMNILKFKKKRGKTRDLVRLSVGWFPNVT